MIRIDVMPGANTSEISLVSNDIKKDQDLLDTIGNLILSKGEKRGRFLTDGSVRILIKQETKV